MAESRVILCRCDRADVVPGDTRDQVLAGLADRSVRADVVCDLCELAANKDPLLGQIAESAPLWIVACRERSLRGLFDAADAPLDGRHVTLLDMTSQKAPEILAELPQSLPDAPALDTPDSTGDWAPWFPVIDRERCGNCKTCLNFCLFGVYGLDDDGKVRVDNPANCKNKCPACARACPDVAIVFPKYHTGPISGEPVGPDGLADEPLAVDPASLVAGDVYAALRGRGKGGMFATDPGMEQAQAIRRKHLLEMATEGKTVVGIDQLLSSLSNRTSKDAPGDKKESESPDAR